MSQAESSSDTDSNTSSSWIFLDDCSLNNEQEKNKYYLNCSSEPIQELTPQCLDAMNFEQETDSDGISIISESDDAKEHSLSEEPLLIEDIEYVPAENVVQQVEPRKIEVEYYISKYVVIGWIVIAVMTPLLLNYFSTYMQKTSENFQNDDLLENEKINKLSDDKLFYEGNIELLDHLAHQECDYNTNTLNKKKRIDSKGEIDIHRLNCHKQQYSQLDMNMGKEKEWKQNEKNRDGFFLKDDKHEFIKNTIDVIGKLSTDKKIAGDMANYESENEEILKERNFPVEIQENLENKVIVKNMNNKKHKNHKKIEFDSKSHDDSRKKNKDEKSDHKNGTKKKKNKKGKENMFDNPNRDHFYEKEIKKLRKTLEHKEKEIKKLTKTVKAKDKHLKMLEYKILKELHALRKPEKETSQTPKKIDNHFLEKKINSTSGEWYYKLHKGRAKFRNQQYASDWVFDRADFRNRKRNMKNNWYWNWMSDREQLRLKRGFWQFTY